MTGNPENSCISGVLFGHSMPGNFKSGMLIESSK